MRPERIRVIGYTRVSTEEQATEGLSLDDQVDKIRRYCDLYNLELAEVVSDPGHSGKSLDRPGIRRVLDELRRRKSPIGGLVLAKLDRLTRSVGDWSDLVKEFFRDEKKRLCSVNEQVDTKTANGRMFINLIILVAEWEREVIGERTRDALLAKIKNGERVGKVRFGHDLAEDGKSLVENTREQRAIALMKEWRGAGRTYRDIVRLLEELGIETKEGGKLWLPATVRRILTRPA
jgi:DNA invertase Pin-like site-specific DNA recombinase